MNFLLLILSFLLGGESQAPANNFEGSIYMVQKTRYDTINYTYYVKNNRVRIERHGTEKEDIETLLIDLANHTVYALEPDKKMFTEIILSEKKLQKKEHHEFIKTDNSRQINGINCYQWRIRDRENNTEVAFWVTNNDFYFFTDLIKILSHIEENYRLFEYIPEEEGFFPMLSVERTLLRKEKNRMAVTRISREELKGDLFHIPDQYERIRR